MPEGEFDRIIREGLSSPGRRLDRARRSRAAGGKPTRRLIVLASRRSSPLAVG